MAFNQRSYSGQFFRPRPLVEEDRANGTVIVATSWGDPEQARAMVDLIKEQLVTAGNPEATRVGAYIPELNEMGNHLRSAALMANEQLYLKENAKEYGAAVEIALLSVQKQVLTWAQVGTPHLLLQTSNGLQPLASQPDWAWQLQQDAPLVSKALGLERSCYPQCGSYRLQGRERVLLISRSAVPSKIYALNEANLESCAQVLVDDHEETPFWLGILDL